MRHILCGLSVVALLVAALPAAAQSTGSVPQARSTDRDSAAPSAKPVRHKMRQSRAASKSSPNDNMADQLNRQELSQVNQGQAPSSGTSANPAEPTR